MAVGVGRLLGRLGETVGGVVFFIDEGTGAAWLQRSLPGAVRAAVPDGLRRVGLEVLRSWWALVRCLGRRGAVTAALHAVGLLAGILPGRWLGHWLFVGPNGCITARRAYGRCNTTPSRVTRGFYKIPDRRPLAAGHHAPRGHKQPYSVSVAASHSKPRPGWRRGLPLPGAHPRAPHRLAGVGCRACSVSTVRGPGGVASLWSREARRRCTEAMSGGSRLRRLERSSRGSGVVGRWWYGGYLRHLRFRWGRWRGSRARHLRAWGLSVLRGA